MLSEKLYEQGLQLFKDSEFPEAIAVLNNAIRHDPSLVMAYYLKGVCLLHLCKWTPAVMAFQRVTELSPDDGDAYLNIGFAFYQLQNYRQAAEFMQKGIEAGLQDNSLDQAYYNLGLALKDDAATSRNGAYANQFEPALRAFEACLKLNADHTAAYFQIGTVLLALQALTSAIEVFENIVAADPDAPHPMIIKSWVGLATAHCLADHYEPSIACLGQAIKLDPKIKALAANDPVFQKLRESSLAAQFQALFN